MLSRYLLAKYSQLAVAMTAGMLLLGPVAKSANAQMHSPNDVAQDAGQRVANRPTDSSSYRTLYVNSEIGSDSADGIEAQPLRTVTRALEVAPPNTVIVLAPGRYTQGSGEVFPLQLKPGVTIQGTPGSSDRTAIIEGGGSFTSPTRSQQNATIIAADRAGIAQVAISNPDGYGLWVEATSPTILESAFVGNRQTGIYVAGGSPRVQGSYFSGNQVAGVIVFGVSSANIHQNIFDGTGDAIRIVDGATPEIVGNRITNNDAGLVLIGNAQPVVRDNQIAGNRQNDVVEVAARPRDITASTNLSADIEEDKISVEPLASASIEAAPLDSAEPLETIPAPPDTVTVAANSFRDTSTALPPLPAESLSATESLPAEPLPQVQPEPSVAPLPATPIVAEEPAPAQPLPVRPAPAQLEPIEQVAEPIAAVPEADEATLNADDLPAGAPGSARQALQSSLGERTTIASRDDSPGSLLQNRRRRRRRRPRPEPDTREPETRRAPAINNNRLAVPNTSIPLGSGESATIFTPPSGGSSSRAQSLGLYYRVFVNANEPFEQEAVRDVVPDSFRTWFDGRTVMQVGAFPTEEEAEDRRRLLEDNDFDVSVEYIRN